MTEETTTLTGQMPPPVRDRPALDLEGTESDPVRADLMHEGPLTPYCIGAVLVRLQTGPLVGTPLDRMPGLRLAVTADQVVRRRETMIRGPRPLPVMW